MEPAGGAAVMAGRTLIAQSGQSLKPHPLIRNPFDSSMCHVLQTRKRMYKEMHQPWSQQEEQQSWQASAEP